jgi:transposase
MVLMAAEGESISVIARSLGTCRARVGQWLQRFRERRLEGLEDLPRSGRPPEITPLERHQVIATACRCPADFGFQRVELNRFAVVLSCSCLFHLSSFYFFTPRYRLF